MIIDAIARLIAGAAGHNTINTRTVCIFFQKFPGTSSSGGIAGLDFRVLNADGTVAQQGRTPADGRIRIRQPAGDASRLEILGSVYEISQLGRALHPRDELRGVQERLNMLGYNAGALRADNQRADAPDTAGTMGLNDSADTERAILNFQADQGLFPDAMFGPQSQSKLRSVMSSSGGE
jgi:peptidoglycan hydrolase-like protein with peptidoglycan-binding domain